jgi:hypothetical protein
MSFWKKVLDWSLIGVSFAIKKKNPAWSQIVDESVKAIKDKDYKLLSNKVSGFAIAAEEQKILDDLEDQRKKREIVLKDKDITVSEVKQDESESKKLIKQSNAKHFSTKYFTKPQLLEAPINMEITNLDYRFIAYKCDGFIMGKHGHFSCAIMEDGSLMLAGHGGNAHNVGLTKTDYIKDTSKIKYYFLVWVYMEGNPRGVLGISNVVKRVK